ncbi:uncharacterized protein HaLaN_17950, partial [Haematococcus lacustris]
LLTAHARIPVYYSWGLLSVGGNFGGRVIAEPSGLYTRGYRRARSSYEALGDSAQPIAAQTGESVPRRLKSWLQQRGANVQSIDFRPSKAGEEAGYGLFLAQDAKTLSSRTTTHWFRPWIRAPPEGPVAASFPLHLAITAANIISDA